jgi:hypothetical protein
VPLEKGRCHGTYWHIEVPLQRLKRRFPDGPKVEPHRWCKPPVGDAGPLQHVVRCSWLMK